MLNETETEIENIRIVFFNLIKETYYSTQTKTHLTPHSHWRGVLVFSF